MRVRPAHERLDADDVAALEVQQRLVVHDDLAAVQRAAQLGEPAQAPGLASPARVRAKACGRPWALAWCRAASARRRSVAASRPSAGQSEMPAVAST